MGPRLELHDHGRTPGAARTAWALKTLSVPKPLVLRGRWPRFAAEITVGESGVEYFHVLGDEEKTCHDRTREMSTAVTSPGHFSGVLPCTTAEQAQGGPCWKLHTM